MTDHHYPALWFYSQMPLKNKQTNKTKFFLLVHQFGILHIDPPFGSARLYSLNSWNKRVPEKFRI